MQSESDSHPVIRRDLLDPAFQNAACLIRAWLERQDCALTHVRLTMGWREEEVFGPARPYLEIAYSPLRPEGVPIGIPALLEAAILSPLEPEADRWMPDDLPRAPTPGKVSLSRSATILPARLSAHYRLAAARQLEAILPVEKPRDMVLLRVETT